MRAYHEYSPGTLDLTFFSAICDPASLYPTQGRIRP
jgi:hypothetical protein